MMSDVSGQAHAGTERIPDISILIVTYNSAKTIVACVDSVLSDLPGLKGEIIIVDNQSSDATPQLLGKMARDSTTVSVILNKHNRGFAVGNNQALEASSGTFVFILNPDTVIHPGTLQGLIQKLKTEPQVAVTAPRMQFPDGRIQYTCRRFPGHLDVLYHSLGLAQIFPMSQRFNAWKMGDFDHLSAREVDQPAGAALMIRGHVLRELEGFDPNFPMFFNDVDLCKRIKDAGYEIWFLPEVIVDHEGGASVKQVKLKMTISSHVSFFRYFEKHFTRLHQQPFNFMVGILLYLSLIPRLLFLLIAGNATTKSRSTL
jgi:GT2 family glycosyltransferase